MKEIVKRYSNGEITVVWKPDLCIHSGNCFRGLPSVFKPRQHPWVTIEGAGSEAIVAQVGRCPSGALTIAVAAAAGAATSPEPASADVVRIEVTANGPLEVHGEIAIAHPGGVVERRSEVTSLCRCGGSANKPYCDGTHRRNGFRG